MARRVAIGILPTSLTCWRILILLINVAFSISGVVLVTYGAWFKIRYAIVSDLYPYSELVPFILTTVGLGVLIASGIAFGHIEKPPFIYIYCSLLLFFFVIEMGFALVAISRRPYMQTTIFNSLQRRMHAYIKGGHDKYMDFIQITFVCCGVYEPYDWFKKNSSYAPVSCCSNVTCNLEDPATLSQEGCGQVVVDYLVDNSGFIAVVLLSSSFLPLFGVLLTGCLAYELYETQRAKRKLERMRQKSSNI